MMHMPTCHELVRRCLCHLVETNLFSFFSASRDTCCIESLKKMVCTNQMKCLILYFFYLILFTLFDYFCQCLD